MTLTCSAIRAETGEPLAGTAPHARLWVLLEQPGPWGRDALVESHLDIDVGRALAHLADERPVRVGLIRSVGEHADHRGGPRTLLVARTDASAPWLAARSVVDTTAVPHALDVDRLLSAGAPPPELPGEAMHTSARAVLVCTNSKRDQCCAVLGRPLAAAFAATSGAGTGVWETSHTGGHRFAPTFVSLPDGYLFGGPDAASRSLDACRGRSSLPQAAQVAELAVLREIGERHPRPLDVQPLGDDAYLVREGSRVFTVTVTSTQGPERPESCGRSAVPSQQLAAEVRT